MELGKTILDSILAELCKLSEITKNILALLVLERMESIEAIKASQKVIFRRPVGQDQNRSCADSQFPESSLETTFQKCGKQEE